MYDWRWKASYAPPLKTICVGNLSLGGTGKSPMTEYIIKFLKNNFHVATLSRGYKRKTKGFAEVLVNSSFEECGDEPKQFKNKFPDVFVTVCEDRKTGINKIVEKKKETEIIILDDAYQHRKVKAGLNVLLTDYKKIFTRDFLFPSGTLRESAVGAARADVIVVTKCPSDLNENERKKISKKISSRNKSCKILFSFIKYSELKSLNDGTEFNDAKSKTLVLLFAGIASPSPLIKHLKKDFEEVHLIRFNDHHEYSVNDLMRIHETFNKFATLKKIIVTTEKDAMRLEKPGIVEVVKKLPVYIAPIETDFSTTDKETFNKILTDYAKHD